jgi:N-acetylmuramoyl-L-alanine amidase
VIMTRTYDTTIDNKDRTMLLQSQWPDLLISFHLNSSANPATQGVSTYYKHVAYRPLTQALLKRVLEIDGMKEYGNVGSFNFQLIQPTEYNSSLVEIAFLSNREDEKRIMDQNFRQKIAEQVEKGIEDWLKDVEEQ